MILCYNIDMPYPYPFLFSEKILADFPFCIQQHLQTSQFELSEHYHPSLEILAFDNVTCTITIGKEIVNIDKEPTIVILAPYLIHRINYSQKGGQHSVIHIAIDSLNQLFNFHALLAYENKRFRSDFHILSSSSAKDLIQLSSKSSHSTILKLIFPLLIDFTEEIKKEKKSQWLKDVESIIRIDQEKALRVKDIAQKMSLNKEYFSRKFRHETGMTFSDYHKRFKISQSKILLAKNFNIGEVSEILYFSSPSHFVATFKKETGITPKKYQQIKNSTTLF